MDCYKAYNTSDKHICGPLITNTNLQMNNPITHAQAQQTGLKAPSQNI